MTRRRKNQLPYLFEEEGDIKTAFVISAPESREGHCKVHDEWNKIMKQYGDEDAYLNKVKDQFINGEEIEILIVVDKLLIGFDVPRACVLFGKSRKRDWKLLRDVDRGFKQ